MDRQNDSAMTEGTTVPPKRTAKDSVFCDLFRDPENLLELYRCLHPEDTTATVNDLGNVTLRNVLVDDQYNDLGFTVRDRQLILLEAQSTWSANIVLRILMYLTETWNAALVSENLYSTVPVHLPKPELYVLYTGDRKDRPEWLSLAETYFDGDNTYLEVKVRMLYGDGSVDGILNQYVLFTKVFDEQVRLYGRTEKAVAETIRICREVGALEKYLASHEREVVRIMTSLFDQDHVTKNYVAEEKRLSRALGRAEGRTEGRAEGEEKKAMENAFRMRDMGFDNSIIAQVVNVSLTKLQSWFKDSSTSMPQA